MPDYFARHFPNAQIDVVEIDPELFNIAQRYFNVEDWSNMNVYGEDARGFVNRGGNGEKYDFILVGVSHDIAMPWQFVTREFGEAVRKMLVDDGVVAVNLIAAETGGCGQLFDAVYGAYASAFAHRYLIREDVAPERLANTVLLLSRQEKPEMGIAPLDREIDAVYTDRFAPIEHLLLQCHR